MQLTGKGVTNSLQGVPVISAQLLSRQQPKHRDMHNLGLPGWCSRECFSEVPSELSELTIAICKADKQGATFCKKDSVNLHSAGKSGYAAHDLVLAGALESLTGGSLGRVEQVACEWLVICWMTALVTPYHHVAEIINS